MSPEVDSTKYFGVHHTEADTVDRIDPTDLARHVAALAAMTYVVADMPARLGEVDRYAMTNVNHRDTEDTKDAQRTICCPDVPCVEDLRVPSVLCAFSVSLCRCG